MPARKQGHDKRGPTPAGTLMALAASAMIAAGGAHARASEGAAAPRPDRPTVGIILIAPSTGMQPTFWLRDRSGRWRMVDQTAFEQAGTDITMRSVTVATVSRFHGGGSVITMTTVRDNRSGESRVVRGFAMPIPPMIPPGEDRR
jgi:hypothetical protein